MLSFKVDKKKCTRCGECAADCIAGIIKMEDDAPSIPPELEEACYKCQHCMAVCPTGAVSIFDLSPAKSQPKAGLPTPLQLASLMKVRRSVRRYEEGNVDRGLIQNLLEVAWHAPTGVNARQVRFTVVDDRAKLAKLRGEIMEGLGRLVREDALPEGYERFRGIVSAWEEKGEDIIFRNAPHIVVASTPKSVPTPLADCLIALTYFELYAQANGVGTVWAGLAKYAIDDLLPETRKKLGIPDDHLVGYVMIFGKPAVSYARGVQHRPAMIHTVE
ncbi:nitroreductase family protein [Geomonas sp. RF6]|uniref:nitroreductase family protein n=1 Tax=Geomonas sp. RF6 TaxID=2897342 RepID=UPI001E406CA5|nr:nitroreductase family protein [Geomonas sp. RF6]UFS70583.1 nitroreductase family protein [Geomonas sp. RF6]